MQAFDSILGFRKEGGCHEQKDLALACEENKELSLKARKFSNSYDSQVTQSFRDCSKYGSNSSGFTVLKHSCVDQVWQPSPSSCSLWDRQGCSHHAYGERSTSPRPPPSLRSTTSPFLSLPDSQSAAACPFLVTPDPGPNGPLRHTCRASIVPLGLWERPSMPAPQVSKTQIYQSV